jgi:hypothetical protein
VLQTRLPDVVRNSSIDQLLKQVGDRYDGVQSMIGFVAVTACTGGSSKGEVTCYPAFNGNIIIGKPESIALLLRVPVLNSRAFYMVSDGRTFKMLIPPRNCAIIGSDVVTDSAQKGLEALRPGISLDSLLIHGMQPDEIVSMTQDSRVVENPKKRKDLIQDPDYDIEFLSQPQGQIARTLHVVHIDRVNLLPWRQDIYNAEGKVATIATYSNYEKFGDINFPTTIVIQRPLDELTLTITVQKKTSFNQKLEADTFELGPVPANYTTYNMDDPAVAAIAPCAAHATQSPR